MPVPITQPVAQVPEEAKFRMLGGTCFVSMLIDINGNPQNLRILHCTDPMFAHNSLAAAATYKFKPATTQDGKAVPAAIAIQVNFSLGNPGDPGRDLPMPIGYAFSPPPGATSTGPDANGIYPLTELFARPNAIPQMVEFANKGFEQAVRPFSAGAACDVLITINAKGKPSDAQVSHCDKPVLERPALQSLLKSKFKPAVLNGKAVAVRASVHLSFVGHRP